MTPTPTPEISQKPLGLKYFFPLYGMGKGESHQTCSKSDIIQHGDNTFCYCVAGAVPGVYNLCVPQLHDVMHAGAQRTSFLTKQLHSYVASLLRKKSNTKIPHPMLQLDLKLSSFSQRDCVSSLSLAACG